MSDRAPKADRSAILSDIQFMTMGWADLGAPAIIELRAFAEGRKPTWAHFGMGEVAEAASWAAAVNDAGLNVYAVRNPVRGDCPGAATDPDIIAALMVWADFDSKASTDNIHTFTGPKWTATVLTGRVPSERVHLYWRLAEPCLNMAAWRELQGNIAATFQSDAAVVNPSRVMRIGGTISYPDSKKAARGYVVEASAIRTEYDDDREPVEFDRLIRVFAGKIVPITSAPSAQRERFDRGQAFKRAVSGEGWHSAMIGMVAAYVRKGLHDDEIQALTDPLTTAGYTVEQTRAEVRVAIEGARRKGWGNGAEERPFAPPPEEPAEPEPPSTDPGLVLFVDTPKRHAACEAVRMRLAAEHGIFAFGGVLVVVDHSPAAGLFEDTDKTAPAKFPRPVPVTKDRVVGHIEGVCAWRKMSASGEVPRPVPDWAATMIANGSAEHFPPLAGVIRHPVLDEHNILKSGMIGYDLKSQYFIRAPLAADIDAFEWASPRAALDWLVDDWLGEFRWNERSDAMRALMLCLTLLKARTTLARGGKFPGFMITAPMASTGKTELVECLTRAVTGEGIPFAAFPIDDDTEMNKLLMSIVMSDPSAFCFDNIKNGHSIRSAVLDQFITRDTFGGRILGTNTMGEFPALSVPIATGNNIEAPEDSATRWLEIRLQPKDASPQNAVFAYDAKARTQALRPKILSALREIARVPHDLVAKGRFPAWFAQVAGPVMALAGDRELLKCWGQAGSTIRNGDALEEFLARILATGKDPISATEVVNLAFPQFADLVGSVPPDIYDAVMSDPEPHNLEAVKKRDRAKTQVARFVMKNLNPWRDQIAGGLRLRIIKSKDARGRERDHITLKIVTKPTTNPDHEDFF